MPNVKNATVVKPYLQTTQMTLDQAGPGNVAITDKGASQVILKVQNLTINNSSSIDVLFTVTFDQTSSTSTREYVFSTVVEAGAFKVLVSADAPLYVTGSNELYLSAVAWNATAPNHTSYYATATVSGVEIHA